MTSALDPTLPTTISSVLDRFDEILGWARQRRSRLGYFAALYRRVTLRAQAALAEGAFEDPEAAKRLLVLFAGRYFTALSDHLNGEPTTRSWQVAFDASNRWSYIVLQHLLLGINAHINLDLGIAAARTSPGAAPPKAEFDRVNDLLVEMIDEVQANLAEVWPYLHLVDWLGGRTDEALIGFSIRRARAESWEFTKALLAAMTTAGNNDAALIADRDQRVASIGHKIARPGPLLRLGLGIVRLGERRSVVEIIDLLDDQKLSA